APAPRRDDTPDGRREAHAPPPPCELRRRPPDPPHEERGHTESCGSVDAIVDTRTAEEHLSICQKDRVAEHERDEAHAHEVAPVTTDERRRFVPADPPD